jgi:hypothetical protein
MRSLLVVLMWAAPLVAAADVTRSPAPAAPAQRALPFIEDDYARAVAEAKRRKLPLFVDSWAPW